MNRSSAVDDMDDGHVGRRCTHKRADGQPCRKAPLTGQERCSVHASPREYEQARSDRLAITEARLAAWSGHADVLAESEDVLDAVAARLVSPTDVDALVWEAAAAEFERPAAVDNAGRAHRG